MGAAAAPPAAPAAAGGFVVDVSDFLEEFDENAVAATGKYKGQEVTVTGTVKTIDFDFMDNPYIAITGGGMFEMNAVWCMIDDASQSAGLNSGDNVMVVGTFKEWDMLDVTLDNCSVVGAPAAPMAPAAPAAAGGFEVDASDFLKEFEENAIVATGKYKGKEVTVTGTVETIDFDYWDNPYISVTDGGMFTFRVVRCMINDASQSAGLKSGDNVTVVGTFKEWNIFIGTLRNCSVK